MSSNRRPTPQPRSSPAGAHRARLRPSSFTLRLAAFGLVAVLVVGVAGALIVPRLREPGSDKAADRKVTITMAGFDPARITVPAGKLTSLKLVNPDSSHHTDGGGIHQFAVPALGVDARIDPQSAEVITLPAATPGTYVFYCDTCCGGKENPSMQGTLVVS